MGSVASPSKSPDKPPSQEATNSDSLMTKSEGDGSVFGAADGSAEHGASLIIARSSRHLSFRVRFILAGVSLVFSLVAFCMVAVKPGEQPINLIAVVSASLASLVCLFESLALFRGKEGSGSVFDPLPLLGLAACCAGAFTAVFGAAGSSITPLLVAAPGLAAATVLLGKGFAILGSRSSRRDESYLYTKEIVALKDIKAGQSLTLKTGDLAVADCRILKGCLALDERNLSPLPTFRVREEEEIVYAGSEVLAGSADVVALTSHADACLTQVQSLIGPMLQEAESGLEREDSKASRWSAMAILFLSLAAGIFWNERSPGYVNALLAIGSVALFGAVCQVSALLYGLRRGLVRRWISRGYLLTGASSCKELAQISSVECDPSRSGNESMVQCVALDVLDDRLSITALCDFLSALLGRAENRFLVAAGEYCRRHCGAPSVERVVDLREYNDRGICGVVHGVELSIGSEDFLVERGIMVQPSDGSADVAGLAEGSERVILVAIGDDIVARFHIALNQSAIVPTDNSGAVWEGNVTITRSSGVARALGDTALLIRGDESDLIGQTATREMTTFNSTDGTMRRGTVVAFTPEIAPLESLLNDCRVHSRTVDRLRLLSGFGGLMVLVAAFTGLIAPVVPLVLVAFVGAMVWVSVGRGTTSDGMFPQT
jgi:hypothetical protein